MGTLRLLLALAVVNSHGAGLVPAHLFPDGRNAVQLFYVISGFYMALVLNETYVGTGANGRFYANRILRLWPPYAVVAVLSVMLFATGTVRLFHLTQATAPFFDAVAGFPLPALAALALTNVLVIGQDLLWFVHVDAAGLSWAPFGPDPANNGPSYSLLHPSFSIAIEALFYAVAPFLLRRPAGWVLAFTAAGAAYHLALFYGGGYNVAWSYQAWPSAVVFFGFGALAYRVYKSNLLPSPWVQAGALLLLLPLCLAAMLRPWRFPGLPPMLLAAAAFAGIVAIVFARTRRLKWDRAVGELSYGVYLVHIPVLYYLAPVLPDRWYGIGCVAVVLGLATLLHVLVERPVDRRRHRIVVPLDATPSHRADPRRASGQRSSPA